MIDTDKYEGHKGSLVHSISNEEWKKLSPAAQALIADAPLLLAEVKRLQKENKILAKYMDIVQKYDDALLADGDTDPRWSELYD
jgi:hypothetical protein